MKPKFLLIGATGWVGRHTTDQLNQFGIPWVAADRSLTRTLFSCDTRQKQEVDIRSMNLSAVVNLAGRGTSESEFTSYIALTRKLATVTSESGIRYIHLGSAAEYGNPVVDLIDEHCPACPTSIYGRMKWEASQIAHAGGALVLRPFNLVGPGQPDHTLVGSWISQVKAKSHQPKPIQLGNPDLVRDFISVKFLAKAIVKLGSSDATGFMNVCSGIGTRYEKIFFELLRSMGDPCQVVVGNEPGIPRVVGNPLRLANFGISTNESTEDLIKQVLEPFGQSAN